MSANFVFHEEHIRCTRAFGAHELTKFTKKSEKIIHILSILLLLYTKFQVQICYILAIIKREFVADFLI
jgi:hypothetical protein